MAQGESLLPVNVERRDYLREGHVGGDGAGHTHLVDLQVGVGRNDSPGGEIHTLPHQVSSHSAFFPLQPLLDGFEWTTRFLHCLKRKFDFQHCDVSHSDSDLKFSETLSKLIRQEIRSGELIKRACVY